MTPAGDFQCKVPSIQHNARVHTNLAQHMTPDQQLTFICGHSRYWFSPDFTLCWWSGLVDQGTPTPRMPYYSLTNKGYPKDSIISLSSYIQQLSLEQETIPELALGLFGWLIGGFSV